MVLLIFKNYKLFSHCQISAWLILLFHSVLPALSQEHKRLELAKTINGNITPKSIIYAGYGRFFAQNMMYSHKITVYDRNYRAVRSISDKVKLSELGHPEYRGEFRGAPVEAAYSHNGKYIWVTNYRMYGEGFDNPGFDTCGTDGGYDHSFVYRIDAKTLRIDAAVKAGSVPKYIAVTPDNRYALVTNWCSGDLSVIDIIKLKEVKRIPLGKYPRGIAVDSKSQYAYIVIMGDDEIARINLDDFSVHRFENIGKRPRHLCISNDNKFLYVSLNAEHKVIKIDLEKQQMIASASTGIAPRSMALSADQQYLYVVNYHSQTMSVVATSTMREIQNIPTNEKPIGIATDPQTGDVWVACYSGSIQIFKHTTDLIAKRTFSEQEKITATKPGNHQYHIIVGVFREDKNLNKMIHRCVKAGYQPYIINPESDIKKLSCKGFDDKASALSELNKAKDLFGEGTWLLKMPISSIASR